ncbi:PAS domain S-box/diguanylate cyclase (GGDEF) domain-containing protein [Frankia torreyi]|uniref:PAS domain S-box/diguanylate cyclase (GGDEF) domain-containing protein n=3 Tax=Frankia TaxID=1854 RepID=A0A0D8B8U3_9ACTN|nr:MULTISPECIES: diguanylate cyclase [Frankia]KJE20530.1 PAS domain S-box/diguanylate cyclase (GGDEF) domain-containing protein [Frankia torreyi]
MPLDVQPDLIEILDIAVVEATVRDHRIRRANAAACALFGRPEAEVVGLDWEKITTPADHARLHAQIRFRQASGRRRERMMVRLLQPDGDLRHALATIVLRTDPDGEEYFVVHLQDVSEEIAAQDRLRLIVENTPVSMFLIDRGGRVLVSEGTVSPEAAAGLAEARASSIFTSFAYLPQATSIMRRALDGERVHQVLEAFGRRLDVHLVPIPGPGGRVASVAAVASDVTDLHVALASVRARSAEQAVVADLGRRALEARESAELWQRAVTALADHLGADLVRAYGIDADGKRVGPLAREDRREPEVPTGTQRDPPRSAAGWVTVPVGRPDRPLAMIELHRAPLGEQEREFVHAVTAVLGSAALRFRMEAEIRHRSLHDGLTGLPNRTALLDRLGRALRRADHDGRRVGVLFVDLDGFKAINDTLGHQAGDDLLRTTAARLSHAVRPGDVAGRLAGDEFAVLCEDVDGTADLEAIADRVVTALAAPVRLCDRPVTLTGSVGLALSNPDLADAETLLNAADIAMYTAKRNGPGQRLAYATGMRTPVAASTRQKLTRDQLKTAGADGSMLSLR